jgi:AraC-like DNA-binding protein
MTNPEPFAPVTMSTDAFPENRRLALWREVFGRNVTNVDIEPIDDVPFHAAVTFQALPGVGIATGSGSAAHYNVTREFAAKADDVVALWVVRAGAGTALHLGKEFVGGAGSGTLLSVTDPSISSLRSDGSFMTLIYPRHALSAITPDLGSAFGRTIADNNDALRLLTRYVDALAAGGALATPGLAQAAATHILDLGALVVGASREHAAIARARGVRAARLSGIKSDIMAALGRHDLSRDAIAARHGVTPRYVGKLFEEEGSSFSEFLLGQRLAQAYRMLADQRCAHLTVAGIAYECGFGDLSYFNRSFRRAHGATPSDVREAARPRWQVK